MTPNASRWTKAPPMLLNSANTTDKQLFDNPFESLVTSLSVNQETVDVAIVALAAGSQVGLINNEVAKVR